MISKESNNNDSKKQYPHLEGTQINPQGTPYRPSGNNAVLHYKSAKNKNKIGDEEIEEPR